MTRPKTSPLHRAAQGAAGTIQSTLKATQAALQREEQGVRLAEAVYQDDLAAMTAHLKAGVSPDTPIPGRPYTPLMVACGRENLPMVRLLLDHGANLDFVAPGVGTPLVFALASNTQAALPVLLQAGADPNLASLGGVPPLVHAIHQRDETSATVLLEHGADPNATDAQGYSALVMALDQEMDDLAMTLVRRGARGDGMAPDGSTPLGMVLEGMLEPLALAMLETPDLDLKRCGSSTGAACALGLAAAGGMLQVVQRLLDLGHPVDGFDARGGTPLFYAILFGQPEVTQVLLDRGASWIVPDEVALTEKDPFLTAACVGDVALLDAAAAQGRDPLAPLLQLAAARGNAPAALAWLAAKGMPPYPTALHMAAFRACTEAVAWFLANGLDTRCPDSEGNLPLFSALEDEIILAKPSVQLEDLSAPEARLATVRTLLEAGASLAELVQASPDVVYALLERCREEVLLPLFDLGLPRPEPSEVLLCAALRGSMTLLEDALAHGADVNAADPQSQETALGLAAFGGNEDLLLRLLDEGADMARQDVEGKSPLLTAVEEGHKRCAEVLLERGADPNHQDAQGWTALMVATANGHAAIVQLLLRHGAKRHFKNHEQATAMTYARKAKRKDLMKLLS